MLTYAVSGSLINASKEKTLHIKFCAATPAAILSDNVRRNITMLVPPSYISTSNNMSFPEQFELLL